MARGVPIGILLLVGAAGAAALIFFASKAKAAPPPGNWPCPYCGQSFDSYEDVVQHILSAHPGERIPLAIEWE